MACTSVVTVMFDSENEVVPRHLSAEPDTSTATLRHRLPVQPVLRIVKTPKFVPVRSQLTLPKIKMTMKTTSTASSEADEALRAMQLAPMMECWRIVRASGATVEDDDCRRSDQSRHRHRRHHRRRSKKDKQDKKSQSHKTTSEKLSKPKDISRQHSNSSSLRLPILPSFNLEQRSDRSQHRRRHVPHQTEETCRRNETHRHGHSVRRFEQQV